MKDFNIETYLEGGLSGKALETFEAEMQSNPRFAQMVKRMSNLKEDLEMESLREEVKNIISPENSDPDNNRKPGRWFGLLAGVAIIGLAGYFLMSPDKKEVTPSIAPMEKQEEPTTDQREQIQETNKNKTTPETKTKKEKKAPVIKKTKPKDNRPMAENNKTTNIPPPLHPSPNVRGQGEDNKEWKAMLDKIWYTDFPPVTVAAPYSAAAELLKERDFKKAFVKLELLEMKSAATDTLRLLKGYCLLEMGEGADALRYFEQMEKVPKGWESTLQWYRALGVLTVKGISESLPAFKEIEKDKAHPFYLKSKKALEVLE